MDVKKSAPGRAYWLKTMHQWHWISSALCLLGMLLFAFTGITLNHAADIEGQPTTVNRKATLPAPLLGTLVDVAAKASASKQAAADTPVPASVQQWLNNEMQVRVEGKDVEWSANEVYVALPRPGGDAWVRVDLAEGEVEYESTGRGWISYLNDLHKGRHSGLAWSWFIDIFAGACLVFSLTGLLILKFHATNRPSTWPMVGLGVVIPVILALLFVH